MARVVLWPWFGLILGLGASLDCSKYLEMFYEMV